MGRTWAMKSDGSESETPALPSPGLGGAPGAHRGDA